MAKTITGLAPTAIWRGIASAGLGIARASGAEFRYARRTTAGRLGLSIVVLYMVLALFGHWLAPYSPTAFQYDDAGILEQLKPPSANFWLGTDQFGRDVFSRVMSGAGSLIAVSIAGASLGLVFGSMVGLISGYAGGKFDEFVMRVMDGVMSFPALLVALLVLTTLDPNVLNIVGTIGVVFVPGVARIVRSAMLALKELEFVQNARLRGEPSWYIIFWEILPNVMPVLGVEAPIRLSFAILLVSSLGFLGMGVQPPSSDWGLMISEGRKFVVSAPWVALAPAVAVAILVVGVNLLVDGLRQARGMRASLS